MAAVLDAEHARAAVCGAAGSLQVETNKLATAASDREAEQEKAGIPAVPTDLGVEPGDQVLQLSADESSCPPLLPPGVGAPRLPTARCCATRWPAHQATGGEASAMRKPTYARQCESRRAPAPAM